MDGKYNGWTNYETWCVNLWLTNDQGSYECALDMARESWEENDELRVRVSDMAQRLENLHDESREEFCGDRVGPNVDMLRAAYSLVDWREIAEHFIDEIAEQNE